jgi:hypothetical protein
MALCSAVDARFGSKADIGTAKRNVRFTPNRDRKSGFPHKVMSALPPKADMCSATTDVRFGPKADISLLFYQLVGTGEQRRRNRDAKRLGCFEIDNKLILRSLLYREVGRLCAFKYFVYIGGGPST